MLGKKEPSLEECQLTLCIMTCDCLNCEKQKEKVPLMERGIAIKYCRDRLGLKENDDIRLSTNNNS